MLGYVYVGLCGAEITERWQDDMQFVQCECGRGMQTDGGCEPIELCDDCSRGAL